MAAMEGGASSPLYVPYRCADMKLPRMQTYDTHAQHPYQRDRCHDCGQPVWVQRCNVTPKTIIVCSRCMGYLK